MQIPKQTLRSRSQWLAAALWGATAIAVPHLVPATAQEPDAQTPTPELTPPEEPLPLADEPLPHVNVDVPVYGAPPPENALTPAIIKHAISRQMNKVRFCYERVLITDPKVRGLIKLAFTISTEGNITEIHTESDSTGSPALGSCVVAVVKGLQFPRSSAPKKVLYPFTFEPPEPSPPGPKAKEPSDPPQELTP